MGSYLMLQDSEWKIISLGPPKTNFSAQWRFICSGGTEGRIKRQRQEIEDEGERDGNKGE